MTLKFSSKHQNSTVFLKRMVQEARVSGVLTLPSIKQLAQSAGVSVVTMWKAVQSLALSDLVVVNRGGIVVRDRKTSNDQSTFTHTISKENIPRWAQIRDQIIEDITKGILKDDCSLDPAKVYLNRFSVSKLTLQKALKSLQDDKLIVPFKRWYKTAEYYKDQRSKSLVIFARSSDKAGLMRMTPRTEEFWRTLEKYCTQHNIFVFVHSLDDLITLTSESAKLKKMLTSERLLGCFVLTLGFLSQELQQVCTVLGDLKIRVSLLNESSDLNEQIHVKSPQQKLFISGSAITPGKLMGEYLLSKGHTNLAFLSISGPVSDDWVNKRIEGLSLAYFKRNIKFHIEKVTIYNDPIVSSDWDHIDLDPDTNTFIENIRIYLNSHEPGITNHEYFFLSHQVQHLLWSRKMYLKFVPQFNELLKNKQCKVWVGMNDYVAIMINNFLNHAGLKSISVVGFDDISEAWANDITSYNFNIPSVVNAMLHHLVYRSDKEIFVQKNTIDIEGMVMSRGSC